MRRIVLAGMLTLPLHGCGANAIGVWVQYPETERSFSWQWSFQQPDPAWHKPDAQKEQVVGVPTWM
jgi:hypothetical protein